MIILWVIGYGIIYFAAEKISVQTGFPHMITAFALGIFLCAAVIALLKGNKAKLWGVKTPLPKYWVATLPLLVLPAANVYFSLSAQREMPDIWHLLTVIFAAACEELLFRGYLVVFLTRSFKKGIVCVAAANAALFGIFHLLNISGQGFYYTLLQAVCAASVGFAFVIVTFKADSILPCIVVHCLINASSVSQEGMVLDTETAVAFVAVSVWYVLYGIILCCNGFSMKRSKRNEALH